MEGGGEVALGFEVLRACGGEGGEGLVDGGEEGGGGGQGAVSGDFFRENNGCGTEAAVGI